MVDALKAKASRHRRRDGRASHLSLLVLAAMPLTLLSACGGSGSSSARSEVTVMTRNLDEGTDFGFVVGAGAQPFSKGAPATWLEVLQSGIETRAGLVADEIASAQPDLVSLQEVAKWTGPGSGGTVTLDAQAALMRRLVADGAHYQQIEVVPEEQLSADLGGLKVTFLDQDVLLARTDQPSHLKLSNPRQGHFAHLLTFNLPVIGQVQVTRGWASVDATVGGRTVRFVATHLESYDPAVRLLQTTELTAAGGPADTSMPVILAGDLNTGPNNRPGGAGADMAAAYNRLTGSSGGFRDVWQMLYPGAPGYTDSFHTEDPFVDNTTPSERIDLILVKGAVSPVSVRLVGTAKVNGAWPSDHAGPVAVLRLTGS